MKIGYIRVSTSDQNLDLQKDELQKFGCTKIFEDKISGSLSKAERQGLNSAIEYARKGDIIVVWKLDRLGRSIGDLINIINELNQKEVGFKTITGDIDTTTSGGKLIFHIFAALAEFEKELIKERTLAGLSAARARGRIGGRPSKINADKIRMAKQLHSDKNNKIKDILKILDIKKSIFYKMLKI
jgi:DNA invertase Pin-like site-specific DNA recombinase